ncbi:hypothetical protein [Amycolatopsis sp. lyj-108]|uniref:hypothetical protein n=1 Tax=Amycolatopsis sp. lyj-108 TaxID=2789286 RepID=UPI00397A9585
MTVERGGRKGVVCGVVVVAWPLFGQYRDGGAVGGDEPDCFDGADLLDEHGGGVRRRRCGGE